MLEHRQVLSRGELAELFHESLVFVVVEHIDLDRVLLVTCVVEAACMHPPKFGGIGIAE